MGPVIARLPAFRLPLTSAVLKAAPVAALAAGLLGGGVPAHAQSCLEQIVSVQQQLKAKLPRPSSPPPTAPQSVGAQDGRQPTPGSLAAAGVTQPDSGAFGALNAAMDRQAAGDEAGYLKALAEARRLGGLD